MGDPKQTQSAVHESEEFWERFSASASLHPANLYRYDLIADLVARDKQQHQTIVDLGCGNGSLLSYFHHRGFGTRLLGVDGSAAIIQHNKKRLPFAEFQQADLQLAKQFPLEIQADVVTCSEVIEHMPDYAPVFDIAHRLLRPGGLFILTTQGGKRRRHDIELLGHLRHYNILELAAETAAKGFEILRKQEAGWPALTLQKVAASMFMNRVAKELASHEEPSLLFRLACRIVGIFLKCSSKSFGPQLVIVARKPDIQIS